MTALAEQTRARYPDEAGDIDRDGVRVHWERYGDGGQAILFLPTWSIIDSRCWKAQVPYFARRHRVVVFDPRGNGRSGRPVDVAAYAEAEFAADAVAVLDASGTESAVIVGLSLGAERGLILASQHPERVDGLIVLGAGVSLAEPTPERAEAFARFHEVRADTGPWHRYNAHYWRRDFRGFLEFFFAQVFTEPHSTKQIEDCVGWGMECGVDCLTASEDAPGLGDRVAETAARVDCPVLVIHGDEDAIAPHTAGAELARLTGGSLVTVEGGGHCLQAREPVLVNRLIRDAVAATPRSRWLRALRRPKRALYISSPIGLGHAWRDVAIADELRRLHPDLEIDWLAQDPVTRVLEARGERIHPASSDLASESTHIASEAAEHDLHVFQAIRRMDEILVANFMVFHDLVEAEPYDVWIADEGWEIDYFLHENPELKTAAYCWLTDFVGWLPMPDGGEREELLTADLNAEMIEHIARFPRIRDRAIFVGHPDDIVADTFGPGLPRIREWSEDHFQFSGYVTGPLAEAGRRADLRAELGYGPDDQVCIATVGGSGVGEALLQLVAAAFDDARRLVPGLRMLLVAGPRIDPASFPNRDGIEVRPYVHELRRQLAACDLAIVQGGLGTTMELAATRRPFIFFPLGHHFEQQFHVRHRLTRYGAGRCMDFAASSPGALAAAIAQEIGKEVGYRDVETDGAARAAALISEVL
jgi:pimeloyl-ACP methyl ester carboxylesterase/predicted glycosyltransferase